MSAGLARVEAKMESAQQLALKAGVKATAVIKASSVMVGVDH